MATAARSLLYPTLLDVAKRTDPDGKIAAIAELLSEMNPILADAVWKEGNLPIGERCTVRTGLPSSYWRLLNQAVPASTSKTAQVDEGCGMLEAWGIVDKDLAELNGNTAAFRLSEAIAQMEGMNQTMATAMFYGNASTNPEQFNGLDVRFNSTAAANKNNLVLAGDGSAAVNQDIWLVVWSPNTAYCIYPKGSKAGITHQDLGEQTIYTTSNVAGGAATGQYRAYQDHWQWKCGLVVKDWRYVARVCNINVTALHSNSSAADINRCMVSATHRIWNLNAGRAAWYMSRTLAEHMDLQSRAGVSGSPLVAMNGSFGTQQPGGNSQLESFQGERVLSFRGIPIRVCDTIVTSANKVS